MIYEYHDPEGIGFEHQLFLFYYEFNRIQFFCNFKCASPKTETTHLNLDLVRSTFSKNILLYNLKQNTF